MYYNSHIYTIFITSCLAVGCLLFVIITYLLPMSTVAAQSQVVAAKPKGLTLSPLRSELDITPGTSLNGILTVTNSTDKVMSVSLNAEEFSVIDPQYDYAFTVESDLTKWVSFVPENTSLVAGETKKISFSVGVPLTAEPGGRYISLFASTNTSAPVGGVSSRQQIASLLYITVRGDVTRSGHLVSLSAPWAIGGQSIWSINLQNTGTTHFRSRYNVSVQNLIGNSVVASMAGDALILPGTVRAVSDTLPSPQLPGIYKVIYTIGLGDTPEAVETRFMVYMPPQALILALVTITLLVTGLWRHRLRKRHVV